MWLKNAVFIFIDNDKRKYIENHEFCKIYKELKVEYNGLLYKKEQLLLDILKRAKLNKSNWYS